jgi:hypothetical protein
LTRDFVDVSTWYLRLVRRCAAAVGSVIWALVASCAQPTQLLVVIDDFDRGGALVTYSSLDVEVRRTGSVGLGNGRGAFGGEALPVSFGVVPAAGDLSHDVEISITAINGSSSQSRLVHTRFQANRRVVVYVDLSPRCDGVVCGVDRVCRSGACVVVPGTATSSDAGPYIRPNRDAEFEIDPPPEACYPDGGMIVGPTPTGSPDCPPDRRREGCRCDSVGETGACWPGLSRNRSRGICHDGMTTCLPLDEFGGAWGPCEGAVLPASGASLGPQACECFSMGRWAIDNLSPCFVTFMDGSTSAVSTFIGPGGSPMCPSSIPSAPPLAPQPGTTWSTNRLTVDCEGEYHLCYTLRAGDAMAPVASDCVLARVCAESWYSAPGVAQPFPDLPAWTSSDSSCATRFRDVGGYGEMSVEGRTRECDPIDDGMGGPYVFNRVTYCPLRCAMTPTLPECMNCSAGGGGMF